jgi:hypothetical protein
MLPGRYVPDAEFAPAPLGTRVRLLTLLSAVIAVVVALVITGQLLASRRPPPWPALLPVGVAPAVVAGIWFGARIRRYRLVGAELLVELRFRTIRFPLEGLKEVMPDRKALQGARKLVGNDGLGAISGRFRSKYLGPFRVYATDSDHAVVLRWPDRCLVISPQQHSFFVETLRKRAGLSR